MGRGVRVSGFAAAVLLALAACLPAAAQGRDDRARVPSLGGVDFGLDGFMPTERWAPVRVVVVPGDAPMALVVRVRTIADATQMAEVLAPVVATPGRPVSVQTLVCQAHESNEIEVSLHVAGADGVTPTEPAINRVSFSMYPNELQGQLPPMLAPDAFVLATVGAGPTLDRDVLRTVARTPDNTNRPVLHLARLDPAALPQVWAGYQAMGVLVVRGAAATAVEPRTRSAVHEWLCRGGRLVILAHEPGDEWRAWLPEGAARGVGLDESRRAPLPRAVGRLVRGDAVESAATRRVDLGPQAVGAGWRVLWGEGDGQGIGTAGAAVVGPVGLGMVVVTGLDPASTSNVVSAAACRLVWADLLAPLAPTRNVTAKGEQVYFSGSGESAAMSAAMERLLDGMADVPPVSGTVFLAIALSMVLLAVMVGPGDYLLLGRTRRRHLSALTAPIWIAAATGVAYWGPVVLRPGETIVRRTSALDVVMGDGSEPTYAAQRSLTSVFANFSGVETFRPRAPGSGGAAWRGVSPLWAWGDGGSNRPVMQLLLRPGGAQGSRALAPAPTPDEGASDPAGGVLPSPGVDLRRWTLRTFLDDGRAAAPVATIGPGSDDELATVLFGGLPSGATIGPCAALTSAGWHAAAAERRDDRWIVRIRRTASVEPPEAWKPQTVAQARYRGVGQAERWRPADAMTLAEPTGRGRSLELRAASGRWVVVHAVIDGAEPDVALGRPASERRMVVLRLAAPLPESAHGAPAPVPTGRGGAAPAEPAEEDREP